jgi:hypothetical protein
MQDRNTDLPDLDIIDTPQEPFDRELTYYLAGPMSGYPHYNFPEFEYFAEILREAGIKVNAPNEIDHGETIETRGGLPYETYLQAGLALLEKSEGIILLAGWPRSTGACRELSRSIDLGMPVYFIFDPQGSCDNVQLISMNRRPPA